MTSQIRVWTLNLILLLIWRKIKLISSDTQDVPITKDGPVLLNVSIFIDDVNSFNELNMDFRMDYYLRHKWTVFGSTCDEYREKLVISKVKSTKTKNDQIIINDVDQCDLFWCPDTFLETAKSSFMPTDVTNARVLRIAVNDDCDLVYDIKLAAIVSCQMNFRNYPFDLQKCSLYFRSYSYDHRDVSLRWGSQPWVNPASRILQHSLLVTSGNTITETLGVKYSSLCINMTYQRKIQNTLIRMYAPSFTIVVLSWFSFWLALDSVPGRIALCVTSLLALVTQFASETETLPPVSYINAADLWMLVCVTFVSGTLLEFAIVKYIYYIAEKRYQELMKAHFSPLDLETGEPHQLEGLRFVPKGEEGRRAKAPPLYAIINRSVMAVVPLQERRREEQDDNREEGGKRETTQAKTPNVRAWVGSSDWVKSGDRDRITEAFKKFMEVMRQVFCWNRVEEDALVQRLQVLEVMMEERGERQGKGKGKDLYNQIDLLSRYCFPGVFFIFNIIYWPVMFSNVFG